MDDASGCNQADESRAPRESVFLKATVDRFGTGGTSVHRVRDLSSGGMRIDKAGHLVVGATVLVAVGSLEAVGATVVWIGDGCAGLRFATAVDPEAARARAAVKRTDVGSDRARRDMTPSAGWIPDLKDAYRR